MNKLEAVNESLEWVQAPPADALDTGGNSDEADAERTLDRVSKEVQARGWYANTEELSLGVPNTKIAVAGAGNGEDFIYGETVTESVSLATGTFDHILDGFMYIHRVTGTFTGGQTITGTTSGATRLGGAYTAITTSRIALNPEELIRVKPSELEGESQRIVARGSFFWDTEDNTYDFDSTEDLDLTIVRFLDFDELPHNLAQYIAKKAAWSFMRFRFPGRVDSEDRRNELRAAKAAAWNEDVELSRANTLTTGEVLRFKGERYRNGGEAIRVG